MSYIAQILEEISHKTAAVCSPTSYLWNHPRSDEQDMRDTAGEVKTNLLVIFSCVPYHTDEQVLDDQIEHIYNSSV